MKFEQLLQVFWVKTFLYGIDAYPYENCYTTDLLKFNGIGRTTFFNIQKKFELTTFF